MTLIFYGPFQKAPYQIEGKAEFTAKMQDWMCGMDCLVICRFTQVGKAVTISNQTDWINFL